MYYVVPSTGIVYYTYSYKYYSLVMSHYLPELEYGISMSSVYYRYLLLLPESYERNLESCHEMSVQNTLRKVVPR